jgi:type II secretory ATPase GspE/PulE/Tfp pilus assembly ATPase PilB-like protein
MQKANADQIQAQAVKNGMTVMLEDGIKKVLSGITTIEEIIRVIRE